MGKYLTHAVLPLVNLYQDEMINMGPVRFDNASKCRDYIDSAFYTNFEEYVDKSLANFMALVDKKLKSIHKIPLSEMTCVALDEIQLIYLNEQQKNEVVFDAIQFLCFLSNIGAFGNNPFGVPNNLKPFLRYAIITEELLMDKKNWPPQYWYSFGGVTIKITHLDSELLECFGKIILTKFLSNNPRWAGHITRAVEYFNRILNRDYSSLIYYGSLLEDVVFLCTAFESLLDVHFASAEKKYTLDKIMHTLQDIFAFKYNEPQRILNLWIRKFYDLRSRIVHGDEIPDQIFHGNINIDIPFINLGMKIFIAALVCELSSHTCLKSDLLYQESEYIKDFYVLLWPQLSILRTIKSILAEIKEKAKRDDDILKKTIELTELESIYLSIYCDRDNYDIKIKSCDEEKLNEIASQIKRIANQEVVHKGMKIRILDLHYIKSLSKTNELIEELKASAC